MILTLCILKIISINPIHIESFGKPRNWDRSWGQYSSTVSISKITIKSFATKLFGKITKTFLKTKYVKKKYQKWGTKNYKNIRIIEKEYSWAGNFSGNKTWIFFIWDIQDCSKSGYLNFFLYPRVDIVESFNLSNIVQKKSFYIYFFWRGVFSVSLNMENIFVNPCLPPRLLKHGKIIFWL